MSSDAISIMFACIWVTMLCMLLFSNHRAQQQVTIYNELIDTLDGIVDVAELLQIQIDELNLRHRAIENKHNTLLGLLPDPVVEEVYTDE